MDVPRFPGSVYHTGLNSMPNAGQKEHFDAFISYRRGSGYGLARSIKSALKERGIYAYLDVDDRKKILFDERFRERIAEAPSFIVVLSANSLDRCHSPEDWLRQEIACAIKAGRTIVPVKLPDFEFPPANELPEDIRKLPSYDASPYFPEMFDESIGRLVGKLRLRPRPIWKRPTFTRALIGLLAVGVIAGCVWYYERVASLRTIKQEQAFHQLEEQQQQLHQESVLMADAKAAEVFAVLILFNELPDRLHVVLGLTLWFEIQRQVIAGTVGEFIVVVIVQSCRYYLRWKNINLWFRLCA